MNFTPERSIFLPLVAISLLAFAPAHASELRGVLPITDRILQLHLVDGKAFPATLGHGDDGHVELSLLNLQLAARPESFTVTSADDPAYAGGVHPEKVGRKTKGREFVNNHWKFDYVPEHWIYLALPGPMKRGKTYTVDLGGLVTGKQKLTLTFDERKTRSETVHVNEIGYAPTAPKKYAYLSAWMGDMGPLSLDRYATAAFHLLDTKTGKYAFTGRPTLRKRLTEPDGGQANEGPHTNYTAADVWQLDFSSFKTPGTYRIVMDRIGCSYPFTVAADAYRKAFVTVARALYHQRCGIALKEPYTKWVRPACHRPETTAFMQTTHRQMDGAYSDGPGGQPLTLTGERRMIWGGWHDAADWDREGGHVAASTDLLMAYECAPKKFKDGELNIPESGNGIPDLVDEAKWNVDYYRRIQRPDGGVSVGIFAESSPKTGEATWTDTMKWYVYAEDPAASYRYAAGACRLAWCLKIAGKAKLGDPYVAGAKKAWEWAGKNMRPGDEPKVRDDRLLAAAALYRITGEKAYEDAFKRDLLIDTPEKPLTVWGQYDQQWGVWTYAMTDRPGMDKPLKRRLVAATLNWARTNNVETAEKRAGRFGFDWYGPVGWGTATTPSVMPLIVAYALSKDAKYLSAQTTTCDYFLGANPLNMVWATGLGPHHPVEVMHTDSWYDGIPEPVPGIVPYGPHHTSDAKDPRPWTAEFAHGTAYPDAKLWPAHELWFEDRLCPTSNEFTVNSLSSAAAAYGLLTAG